MFPGPMLAVLWCMTATPAHAESPSAAVISYQRLGQEKYPSTNTPLALLDQHIAYLKAGGFNVVALGDAVDAVLNGKPLPGKTIAITFDDAYRSVLTEALPRLQQAGFPFTVFVPTAAPGRGHDAMSWDDVRVLAASGVEIGGHSHAHPHMAALSAEALADDLNQTQAVFQRELGRTPRLFAYPYGEAGPAEMAAVRAAGYVAAFGESSGPMYPEADPFYLPRFMLNGTHGAMKRFELIVNTRPLRATRLSPASPILQENPPRLGFELIDPPRLEGLACYGPGGRALPIERNGTVVTVIPAAPFPTGQARINCTVRADGQWYWWGHTMVAGGANQGVALHPRSLSGF